MELYFEGIGLMNDYLKELKKNKILLKIELSKLPFEEKIKRVVEMQKMQKEWMKEKNKPFYVWELT